MPESVGRYTIDIKFGGQPIREAPFYVKAEPVGDASKVKLPGKSLKLKDMCYN